MKLVNMSIIKACTIPRIVTENTCNSAIFIYTHNYMRDSFQFYIQDYYITCDTILSSLTTEINL